MAVAMYTKALLTSTETEGGLSMFSSKRHISISQLLIVVSCQLLDVSYAQDSIVLPKAVLGWGDIGNYELVIPTPGRQTYYFEGIRESFWRDNKPRPLESLDYNLKIDPRRKTQPSLVREFDTKRILRPGAVDPFRVFSEVILVKHDDSNHKVQDIERFLITRSIPPIDDNSIEWSFEPDAALTPFTPITIRVLADTLAEDDRASLELRLVRLGRYLPGGAIEPDEVLKRDDRKVRKGEAVAFGPVLDRVSGAVGRSPAFLVRAEEMTRTNQNNIHLYSLDNAPSISLIRQEPLLAIRSQDGLGLRRKRGIGGYDPNGRYIAPSISPPGFPSLIGNYEIQLLGLGQRILARRGFSVHYPTIIGALSLAKGGGETYTSPPDVTVTLPKNAMGEAVASMLSLRIFRKGRAGTYEADFAFITGNGNRANVGRLTSNATYDESSPVVQFPQEGPWNPGAYVAILSWRDGIEADRINFELGGKPDPKGYARMTPALEIGDLTIEPRGEAPSVHGSRLEFVVLEATSKSPADSGPLIAELFRKGHFTYGCHWREGYYTGSSALVGLDGSAELLAPGEPGPHEIRVFRPMLPTGSGNTPLEFLTVPAANVGDLAKNSRHELVAKHEVNVRAQRIDGLIQYDHEGLSTFLSNTPVKVTDPGSQFVGHRYDVEVWRGAELTPGDGVTVPRIQMQTSGINIINANGTTIGPVIAVENFPYQGLLKRFNTPGNYEVRIFDIAIGAYIARKKIALRDPGPPALPATADYGDNVADDWAAPNDPLRGLSAWMKPTSECADPVFDTPPKLEIVQFWPHDPDTPDDDEYRVATKIWAGHPHLVQAVFQDAPPDSHYAVKVNGGKRIDVYRTDDPKIYRSRVLTFLSDSEIEE